MFAQAVGPYVFLSTVFTDEILVSILSWLLFFVFVVSGYCSFLSYVFVIDKWLFT